MSGEVRGGEGVPVAEDGLDPLADPTGGDAAEQWEHVADVVLQDTAPVTLGEHPVHVLPEAEGAGLLPIGEGAALVEGGVHSDPARGHGAKEDAEHGAGAGSDAAGALEDLHRLEGWVQA